MSILDGDLAGEVADALRAAAVPQSGTLRKSTTTGRDEYGDPIVATTDYAIECWREAFDAMSISAGIPATDIRIIILADGLTVAPAEGDKINLGADWFSVRAIEAIDPAGATYSCDCFGIEAPGDA